MNIEVKEKCKRIDKFLAETSSYSRSTIKKMFDEGLITLNGKTVLPSKEVNIGDSIFIPDDYIKKQELKGEEIPLDILYEDEYIIVLNKPSGMVVHPGAGNFEHTLVNALVNHSTLSSGSDEFRPGIVHRIDKDTSGVLLVAKTDEVHNILADGFKNKTIKRVYIALLKGEFPNKKAVIDAPIGRDKTDRKRMTVTKDNSKEAVTNLEVIKRYKGYTLVKLNLETGRTHQIRVHMKYIGYPVYNDPIYGDKNASEFGQFLHAYSLEFDHPITGEHMYFSSPLPPFFEDFISSLEKQ